MRIPLLLSLSSLLSLEAIIFVDEGDEATNTESAPTGELAGSGWQYQLEYSGANLAREHLGTMISPKHFITVVHISSGDTQAIQPAYFNGEGERIYHIRGGRRIIQYLDDQDTADPSDDTMENTDLAVFEIWETFEDYAELYDRFDEAQRPFLFGEPARFVMMGRGDSRGAEVLVNGSLRGWGPDGSDRRARWGTNRTDGVLTTEVGDLLFAGFDEMPNEGRTDFECQGANVDSGGAWFLEADGEWKLAGINFSVDTFARTINGTGERLAVIDGGGLFLPQPGSNILIPNAGESDNPQNILYYRKSHTYASRVSVHVPAINAIIDPAIATAQLSATERLSSWAGDFGLVGEIDPEGDEDGDGLSNLVEYLTESDPSANTERVVPLQVSFDANGEVTFTVVQSLDLEGRELTWAIEEGNDLSQWAEVGGLTEMTNDSDNVTGRRTLSYRYDQVDATEDTYYRLRASIPSL